MSNKFRFWSGDTISELKENQIFVFGSNPEGRHGAGSAKAAMRFGAKYGIGRGLKGQTYALITKNLSKGYTEKETGITYSTEGYKSLSPEQISSNIQDLYDCANKNPEKQFIVVYKNDTYPNGAPKKSLNGYTGEEIFELFTKNKEVPANMIFHNSFKPLALKLIETPKEQPIQTTVKKDENEKFTFFFTSACECSQWHPAIFTYKDITFTSTEQFMMYSKAKLFGDHEVAERILSWNTCDLMKDFIDGKIGSEGILKNPAVIAKWNEIQKDIKALGREVENYDESIWLSKRVAIVSVGNREKFSQNPHLKAVLMDSDGTTLVEASPYDKIWGIGMNAANKNATNPEKWNGLNLLGKILTELRERFKLELEAKPQTPEKPASSTRQKIKQ